jgi:hypothetical protein
MEILGLHGLQMDTHNCDKQIKIDWQFSIEAARDKMNKQCQKVFAGNMQLKKT